MLGSNGSNGLAGGTNLNGTVPLTIVEGTEAIVNASVNGGSSVPLLVDTGSTGLVIPLKDIGLQHLGLPTGIGMGAYSGGDTYFYLKFNGTINFGNGIVSSPTTVDAVFFSFPGSFSNFASSDGAVGILGVGTSTAGPNTTSPTTALQGNLGQGVLINEPAKELVFGPNPDTRRRHGDRREHHHRPDLHGHQLEWHRHQSRQQHDRRFRWRVRNHPADRTAGRDKFRAGWNTDHRRMPTVTPGLLRTPWTAPTPRRSSPRAARTPGMNPSHRCRYTSTTPTTTLVFDE